MTAYPDLNVEVSSLIPWPPLQHSFQRKTAGSVKELILFIEKKKKKYSQRSIFNVK